MRGQKRYLTKLQKISQTSSPSKQLQSPNQTTSIKSKINPASLASSYLKFKRFQQKKQQHINLDQANKIDFQSSVHESKSQTIDQKNSKINELQQKVIHKKMQLNMMQECFEKRNDDKSQSLNDTFSKAFNAVLKLCSSTQTGKKQYLSMIFKYSQERKKNPKNAFNNLIQWVFRLVKQFFIMVSKLLANCLPKTQ